MKRSLVVVDSRGVHAHMVDLAMRDLDMSLVHANQPLSSIEAFALALVEASSRLGADAALGTGDVGALPVIRDDEPAAE